MVLVLAKLRMGPRTTSIPLSSDALSCKKAKQKQVQFLNQIKEAQVLIPTLSKTFKSRFQISQEDL